MQLLILCGGLASRLGDITKSTPKVLLDIHGRKFLDIILEEYRKAGFSEFILLAGHLADKLKEYESDNIKVIVEDEKLGTGGAVLNALPYLKDNFFTCNGDTFIPFDQVARFAKKNKRSNAVLILGAQAGLRSFSKKDMEKFIPGKWSLERDILPHISRLRYYVGTGRFYDIGTPERLEEFRKFYKRKAVFCDRDGTLVEYVPYLKDSKGIKPKLDVIRKIVALQKKGYLVIMVSNQAGIEKGKITSAEFVKVEKKTDKLLKENGLVLDAKYYCFSADDSDPARKPNPGMIFEARDKFNLDLSQCILVGDRLDVDILAGKNAGIQKLYLADDFAKMGV